MQWTMKWTDSYCLFHGYGFSVVKTNSMRTASGGSSRIHWLIVNFARTRFIGNFVKLLLPWNLWTKESLRISLKIASQRFFLSSSVVLISLILSPCFCHSSILNSLKSRLYDKVSKSKKIIFHKRNKQERLCFV